MSYPVVLVILDRPSIKEPDPGRNTRFAVGEYVFTSTARRRGRACA